MADSAIYKLEQRALVNSDKLIEIPREKEMGGERKRSADHHGTLGSYSVDQIDFKLHAKV